MTLFDDDNVFLPIRTSGNVEHYSARSVSGQLSAVHLRAADEGIT